MAVGSTGTLSSSSITVSVGESGQITWSGGAPSSIVSANVNIATVTKSGLNSGTITVTGVSVGNTTATIQWAEGTSTISITVAASDDTSFLNKRGLAYFWDKIDSKKQNKLTAGSNITISGNTISASQPTVNNGQLTIQKNGSSVGTFTANQSGNTTANIVVPTKTSELTNDSSFVTSSGTVAKANQLTTARTIGISGGATGTATSFNGTANISIPITDVKDAYVTWGGKSIAANITPDDMGCIDEFGHNKLAFLPAECVEVKYSTDGGSTWVDYGMTDASKVKMLSTTGATAYVGGSSDNATASNIANLKLRVRIACGPKTGGRLYTAAKKLLINVSTQGAGGSKVDIKYRTIANYVADTETWSNVGTFDVAGGSGWNSIPFNYTWGGSFTSQTSQIGQFEFVFYSSTLGTWGLKKLSVIDFRLIGSTNWTMPSELARAGHLYTIDENQNATFPGQITATKFNGPATSATYTQYLEGNGRINSADIAHAYPNSDVHQRLDIASASMTTNKPASDGFINTYMWDNSGAYDTQLFLPNGAYNNDGRPQLRYKADTSTTFNWSQWKSLAYLDDVPTKTSDITNDSNFITDANAQKFAIGQGSTQPVFDDMTPIQTIEWDVSDTTYRPIYQFDNTGWTYTNMDITVAYRVTVTGTNINSVTDVVDRWFNPVSWPLTSALMKTQSTTAATTGLRYLRAVYPTSSYLNNNTYKFGMELEMYNTTARHVKVEVFKTDSVVTWNSTKPSGSIYQGSSTYQSTNSIEAYATRGWRFRQPVQMYANSAGQASYMSDFEAVNTAAGDLKNGATALVAGHFAFLADDGLVYDISNTAKNISMGEAKIGFISGAVNANTAIGWTSWRAISRPNATQLGYFNHDTFVLGDRVYLRCTMDSNGNVHSGNYLSKTMSAGYTWMPMGWARSATALYVDTRFPMFYTLDSDGKLSHINGKELSGSGGATYVAGNHIDITNGVISAEDYVHSESPVTTGSVTPVVTNSMITNGTITADKFATGAVLKLTMSTTDIGEGAALAANTLYGVYE